MEVERDDMDGSFTGTEAGIVEDEGKLIREKAREMKSSIFDKREIDDGRINRLVKLVRIQEKEETKEKFWLSTRGGL
ncbi:hypothetical protein EJ110_NYTH02959 [Nymphaea thermarum]|nr:hypothetical protein EJ110_NYTH02959 [Nymphaea thermarum]